MKEFNGAGAWEQLDEETRHEIGAIALELAVVWRGLDQNITDVALLRALENGDAVLCSQLQDRVAEALPTFVNEHPRVPSLLGDVCHECGCSDACACDGGCSWVKPHLCSACQAKEFA